MAMTGPKPKQCTCHPKRKHLALGLCQGCYYRAENRKEKARIWYHNNRESRIAHCNKWRLENPEKVNKIQRDRHAKFKRLVFDGYGNKCYCCGETEILFLNLDHINGGGKQDRKKHGGNQTNFLLSVIKRGFPNEYRILCYNCNLGRDKNNGACPHEKGGGDPHGNE